MFIDEAIEAGLSWPDRLRDEAKHASLMLVLIGENWLMFQDPATGERILDQPTDWVRLEIETAVENGCPIIPVLVDGAHMPNNNAFKRVPSLIPLCSLQALKLRSENWQADLVKLGEQLPSYGFKAKESNVIEIRSENRRVCIDRLPLAPLGQIIGRQSEIDRLFRALASPHATLFGFVAESGWGKTSLIHTFLNRLALKGYLDVTHLLAWSFFSGSICGLGGANTMPFWDRALAFFDYRGPKIRSDVDKARQLAELLILHDGLLVLDGLDVLQSSDGTLDDEAMLQFLLLLCRQGLGPGRLVIFTTQFPLPQLDDFKGRSKPYRNAEQSTLELSQKSRIHLFRSKGVNGRDSDLVKVMPDEGGDLLKLSLLAKTISQLYKGNLSDWRRDAGDRDETVEVLLQRYEEKWGAESPEIWMLFVLSLFDRPINRDLVHIVTKVAHCSSSLGSPRKIGRILEALASSSVITINHDMVDMHPVPRKHFAARFSSLHPERHQEGHRLLFCYFQNVESLPVQSAEDLSSLYRAVFHGCQAGDYAAAFRNVYFPRVSEGRRFFNASVLGDRQGDLMAIRNFFPGGWKYTRNDALEKVEQAWLIAKAAFNLSALGRFAESTVLREHEISLFSELKLWQVAANDSRRLVHTLVPLGRLEDALRVSQKGEEFAPKPAFTPLHESFPWLLDFPDAKETREKCISDTAYVLALLGRYEESITKLETLRGDVDRGIYHRLLQAVLGDRGELERLELIGQDALLSTQTEQGDLAVANLTTALASLKIRLDKHQEAETLLRRAERTFRDSQRLDLLMRTQILRAKLFKALWLKEQNTRQLELCYAEIRQIKDSLHFTQARLLNVDLGLVESEIMLAQGKRVRGMRLLRHVQEEMQSMSYHLPAQEFNAICNTYNIC